MFKITFESIIYIFRKFYNFGHTLKDFLSLSFNALEKKNTNPLKTTKPIDIQNVMMY